MTEKPESHRSETPQFELTDIAGSPFGKTLRFDSKLPCDEIVSILENNPELLEQSLQHGLGLLLLPELSGISDQPQLLLRLSRLCGSSVENYRKTLTREHLIHPAVDEILVLGNQPPSARMPPSQPQPALTEAGSVPVQFPHRRGWHTDQSFRRPPPDISLFYCVIPSLRGQGQTLFASGIAAYDGLTSDVKKTIDSLEGLHALLGTGRSESARRAGDVAKPLLPHQRSQRQPLVRIHPVTQQKALYLCENEQMDWLDGPIVGMTPGPDGDGAKLLYQLMSHYTSPAYSYAHDWSVGDLIIYDNRCLIHSATWYDASAHDRLMWRTTVAGNPGNLYAGEQPSWIPEPGQAPMQGLE